MRSKKINGTIIFNIILLALQFSILVLEMLPNAVMIPFSSGPNSWVTSTFSYFSLTTMFGAVNFCPILSAVLTIISILLCVICLIKKESPLRSKWPWIVLFNILFFVISFNQWFRYGIEYISVPNYCIAALALVTIVFLITFHIRSTKNQPGTASNKNSV